MHGVDELHLLNITVTPAAQGQGLGRFMLSELCVLSRAQGAQQIWLEVRESNLRARDIYARYGFAHIGVRRGYYPASTDTHASGREDAVVMSLQLTGGRDGLD